MFKSPVNEALRDSLRSVDKPVWRDNSDEQTIKSIEGDPSWEADKVDLVEKFYWLTSVFEKNYFVFVD